MNYSLPLITTRLSDVATAIDAGGGSGVLRIYTGTNTLLSSMQVGRPCASVAGNLLTFVSMPWVDPSAVATGAPSKATIEDSLGNLVITNLTVGAGSTSYDIVLSSPIISSGKTIAINPATITGH